MPHADSSFIPSEIATKAEFYAHVQAQLVALLEGSRYWVSNLAQASSLLYHSYLSSPLFGSGENEPTINWVGFYLHPPTTPSTSTSSSPLLLGPYNGRPACITISLSPARGVCAAAFVGEKAVVVPDVEAYPGHIACDGNTKSEIVLPLWIKDPKSPGSNGQGQSRRVIGVLDLDSTVLGTFDEADRQGLEGILDVLYEGCDWS